MMTFSDQAGRKPEKVRGTWTKRSIIIFLSATALVVIGLAASSLMTSVPVLAEKTAHFAAVMRVVRPIILFVILMLWRPVFLRLHQHAWVELSTFKTAIRIWPRLMIWTGLIELTLGQGFVLTGLAAIAAYAVYTRFGKGTEHDR